MKGQSGGGAQPPERTAASDLDCILLFYVGWFKAILVFFAKIGIKLNAMLRSI